MDRPKVQAVTIEPRTFLWAVAEVSWEDSGGIYKVRGTLEDTSQSGACVRVKRPITIGCRVTIKWHREQFSAIARNCRSDGYDFLLGVSVNPPRRRRRARYHERVNRPNPYRTQHPQHNWHLPLRREPRDSVHCENSRRKKS